MQRFRKFGKGPLVSTEAKEVLIHWKARKTHVFLNLITRQKKSKFL